MQAQRGVADQHGALAMDGVAGDAHERVEMTFADPREPPEPLAERSLQLGAKSIGGQRRDALRVAFRQRPNDRRAAARERQERDRAARRETLERSALERRLGAAIEDDGALAVIVLGSLDAERRAHGRAHAVGRDDELGADALEGLAVPQRDDGVPGRASDVGHRRRREHRQPLGLLQAVPEHAAQRLILDRVTERGHVLFGRMDARRAEAAALRDVDRADRLRVALQLVPETEAGEDLLRAVRKCRDARIEARLLE